MNEYFEERAEEMGLLPVSNAHRDDPRYSDADVYKPLPAFEVLRALCTYPGIDGPMFDNAVVSFDADTCQVSIEVDDLLRTEYAFTVEEL